MDQLKFLGFSKIAVAQPPLGKASMLFKEWLQRHYHGGMEYLARRSSERLHPEKLLPHLKSLLVLAFPYDPVPQTKRQSGEAVVSRYAWGEDYHLLLKAKLKTFESFFYAQFPSFHLYFSVDAQPVLEKAWAQKAGLGWLGKHSNVIEKTLGSYFFIATILTDLALRPDPPQADHCGSCTRCLEICPTQAIVKPYVVDARLCISYLTIEYKGVIPLSLRPKMGQHLFGCDDCQEVCPWNRFSQKTPEKAFWGEQGYQDWSLEEWLSLDKATFNKKFKHTPLRRPKYKGMMRNVLIAAGNSGRSCLLPKVKEKLKDSEELVRVHAKWAYEKLWSDSEK